MKNSTITLAASLMLISFSADAGFKAFESAIDESSWQFEGNPLNCRLTHPIPLYGIAHFEQSAGKQQTLDFKLTYKRHPIVSQKVAMVYAIAPSWQPMQANRLLGETPLLSGEHIISSQNTASWKLLNELELGRFPTFTYQDFNSLEDQVSVSLSSVGFQGAYDQFLDCLASLVPYRLNELSRMTFYFDFDRSTIQDADNEKLEALAAYIKYDPSIEVVFIHGFTDSKGSRSYNEKLAKKRIDSVKKILTLDGVPENRFKTTAFGEKKPIASNRTAQGRAKNRRVYIRIAQK